ncbi:MAG: 2-amino-4-hydroxy-6-hydroxymethyldihydropteridine diphosphokinase [Pseudomonadota bacterium]
MADALIALGGNVGDVRETFTHAIPAICSRAGATLLARSSDYLTPPWGKDDQPPFINACIRIETDLPPHALLQVLQTVEAEHGRDRRRETRWGPRTLDLDLLAYDDVTLTDADLTLPHPRLRERAFVLVPLAEIVPDRRIGDLTPRQALAELSTDGIRALPAPPNR